MSSWSNDNLTFLLGSPRSGTSWLGNIIDSHPQTLLRHEPDTIVRGDYPFISDQTYVEAAQRHVAQLVRQRNIKVTGTRPVFQKAYFPTPVWLLRKAIFNAAKGLEKKWAVGSKVQIPDFTSLDKCRVVIKTVSALGRVNSFASAYPKAKFVHILRHPCGHVDSIMRGRNQGFLPMEIPLGFVDTGIAGKYGLTAAALKAMAPERQAAWRWAVLNEKTMADLSNAKLVIYENLCQDPIGQTRSLFDYLDLDLSAQTVTFIKGSTQGTGTYFETKRDSALAANSWKDNFSMADDIVGEIGATKAFRFFEEASSVFNDASKVSSDIID